MLAVVLTVWEGCVTVTVAVAEQLFASDTVTVYVQADRPLTEAVVALEGQRKV